MGSLNLSLSKTLKLTNVLMWRVELSDNEVQFELEIDKMKSYINVNGGKQVGPLVRYLNAEVANDDINVKVVFMMQADRFINVNDRKYKMEATIRVCNCMYCRYIGPEDKINYAYDKIQLTAFENDIPLKGDSYTIFVDRDEENETITADVFMERAD